MHLWTLHRIHTVTNMDEVMVRSLGESCIGYFGAHGASQVRLLVDERRLTARVLITLKDDRPEVRDVVAAIFPEIRRMFIDDLSLEFGFEQGVPREAEPEASMPGMRSLEFA